MIACNKTKKSLSLFLLGGILILSGCSNNGTLTEYFGKNSNDEVYNVDESNLESELPAYVTYDENYEATVETGNNYFQISDRYGMNDNISFQDFYNQDDCIEKMISFHKLLCTNVEYLEFYEQPVQQIGKYDGTISYIQNEDEKMLNQSVTTDSGKKEYVTTLKTIEIGRELNEQLKDAISNGRCFLEEDFIYQNNHKVPVILGSEYQSMYTVGDKLSLEYITDTFDFEIVGFFPKDYTIKHNTVIYCLNNFICIPLFDIPDDLISCDLNKDFLFSYYIEKNSCYVAYEAGNDEDKAEKVKLVKDLVAEADICFDTNDCIYSQFEFSY